MLLVDVREAGDTHHGAGQRQCRPDLRIRPEQFHRRRLFSWYNPRGRRPRPTSRKCHIFVGV